MSTDSFAWTGPQQKTVNESVFYTHKHTRLNTKLFWSYLVRLQCAIPLHPTLCFKSCCTQKTHKVTYTLFMQKKKSTHTWKGPHQDSGYHNNISKNIFNISIIYLISLCYTNTKDTCKKIFLKLQPIFYFVFVKLQSVDLNLRVPPKIILCFSMKNNFECNFIQLICKKYIYNWHYILF